MNKKYLLPLSLLLILPFMNGCTTSESDKVMINSFESINDLYRFKTANTDSSNIVKYDLNTDLNYVTDGNSSLKMEVTSGVIEEVMFPFNIKDNELFKIAKLSSINVDIFNQSENDVTVSLNIYNSNSFNVLLTNSYVLKAKELTTINYSLSGIAIENNYDTIKGLTLRFTNENKVTYYIDNLYATLGIKFTDEDKIYKAKINEIEKDIKLLPEECGLNDYETLKNIYEKYVSLPILYRNIISNYNELLKGIKQYNEAYNAIESTDPLTKTAFRFDDFTGVGSLYNHEIVGGNLKYYYSKDIRYLDEEGSIELNFFGNVWNYMGYSLPADINEYDYLIFHFYNLDEENNQTKRVYFGWNGGYVDCLPNTWTEAKVTPETLLNSSYGMIVNQLNNGFATNSSGQLYIARVTAYRAAYKYLTNAFDDEIPFIGNNVNITINENDVEISAKTSGEIKLNINKNIDEISDGESFKMVVYSPIKTKLSFINKEQETITNRDISIGYNYISLNNKEYNALDCISFENLVVNKTIKIISPVVYKIQYENLVTAMNLLSTMANSITISDIKDVLSFYEAYQLLSNDDISIIGQFDKHFINKVETLTNTIKDGSLLNEYIKQKLSSNSEFALLNSLANNAIINQYCDNDLINKLKESSKLYEVVYGDDSSIKTGIDYKWNGTISRSFDDKIGNCFNINVTEMLFEENYIQFEFNSIRYDGYKTTTLYIYNPLNKEINGNYFNVNPASGAWEDVTGNFVLSANSWNMINFPSNKGNGNRSFIVLMGDVTANGWKISYLYGLTYKITAEAINNKINKLNDTIESDMDKEQILCLKNEYDQLDISARKYITNYSKLENLYKNIEGFEIAKSVDNTTFNFLNTVSEDNTHGPLLVGKIKSIVSNPDPGCIGAIRNNELKKLEQYKEVYFYIYVEEEIINAKFLRQYEADWSKGIFSGTLTKGYNKITISKKEWFNNVALETKDLYLYICSDGTSRTFGITNFYGIK